MAKIKEAELTEFFMHLRQADAASLDQAMKIALKQIRGKISIEGELALVNACLDSGYGT